MAIAFVKGVSRVEQGNLAIILHAHLPFVRHPESEDYLEERWLFEALTESYIPLIQVFEGLIQDGINFAITMSLSPALISMLTDPLLQERYLQHLSKLIELARNEIARIEATSPLHDLAKEYLRRFVSIRNLYLRYDANLITAFRAISDTGHLELITTAATHAFLPLVSTKEAIRAQIATAIDVHTRHLGRRPKGIWLPECAYAPGLDAILRENELNFFFVDSHGLRTANPKPVFGTLSPIVTPQGVAVFARDEESSKQVWSSTEGFPGDDVYREYYRDIGFDLDLDTIGPYIHASGIRVNTGIKYYRITGPGANKEPYSFSEAQAKAAEHAGLFLSYREQQVEYWANQIGRRPIVVAPYDAELFGHWWYEGPEFLNQLFRQLGERPSVLRPITPSQYLNLYTDYQVCDLSMSSWGRGGYADVWLRGENDWIYPALHSAEQKMTILADLTTSANAIVLRAAKQAARELMLAQSSDWAFIMDSKTMVDYAVKRTKYHINRFSKLYNMVISDSIDVNWLYQAESLDNLFPEIRVDYYQSRSNNRSVSSSSGIKVLMLSWEFPPLTVGGLSRHVYDLSRFLTRQGVEVHVVTQEASGRSNYEIQDGVHVHRVHIVKPDGGEFIHWAFQMNLMMVDFCTSLIETDKLTFDVIHAHDWLVSYAAETIKERYNLPLVATIHATEHGRNHGIYTDLQRYIHHLEWQLTREAERVIVCSNFMKREVVSVFQLPEDKVNVLPNGVDPDMFLAPSSTLEGNGPGVSDEGAKSPGVSGHGPTDGGVRGQGTRDQGTRGGRKSRYALEHERIVLFIGRLVREKGVHVLLEAAPAILMRIPEAKFVIVGAGPAEQDLRRRAAQLQLEHKVYFTGFISDEERNQLLHMADVAVFPSLYEPFGIVALEAMAAKVPVVVSDAGGLDDVVEHRRNGLKTYAGDAASIAQQVTELLEDPSLATSLVRQASIDMLRYDWNQIAEDSIRIYEGVLHLHQTELRVAVPSKS